MPDKFPQDRSSGRIQKPHRIIPAPGRDRPAIGAEGNRVDAVVVAGQVALGQRLQQRQRPAHQHRGAATQPRCRDWTQRSMAKGQPNRELQPQGRTASTVLHADRGVRAAVSPYRYSAGKWNHQSGTNEHRGR